MRRSAWLEQSDGERGKTGPLGQGGICFGFVAVFILFAIRNADNLTFVSHLATMLITITPGSKPSPPFLLLCLNARISPNLDALVVTNTLVLGYL